MGKIILNITAPEPLSHTHDVNHFNSGEASLDLWLKTRALQNQNSGVSRTFVISEHSQVIAYYALSTGIIRNNQAIGRFRRNMPSEIPIILLGRLAVDQKAKGLGIGRGLIKDAALRVIQAADIIGVRGLVVHALSEDAKRFYEHVGFTSSLVEPMLLMITLSELKLAMGIHPN